jgi:hypothetical protein
MFIVFRLMTLLKYRLLARLNEPFSKQRILEFKQYVWLRELSTARLLFNKNYRG